jgi:hypothetical protein
VPAKPQATVSGSCAVDLAALMAWTQEAAGRFSRRDFALVLSIARYGRLIDAELQQTLLDLDETVEEHVDRRAAAGGAVR